MDTLVEWILLGLILLGSLQTAFPRKLPAVVKWISIVSSGLAGILVGMYAFVFPINLVAATIFAVVLIALSVLSRWLVSLAYRR